jgi:hypothetical protein
MKDQTSTDMKVTSALKIHIITNNTVTFKAADRSGRAV